jgi:elongation factor G
VRNEVDGTEEAWLELEEAVAMTDDDLLTQYLDSSSLSTDQVLQGLRTAVKEHKLLPLVYTSAEKNLGVVELLDNIVSLLPDPVQAREDALDAVCKNEQGKCGMKPGVEAGFAARVIHTSIDSFGSLSILRVISNGINKEGKFKSIPSSVINLRTGDGVKIGLTTFLLQGKDRVPMQSGAQVLPGNVIALPKLPDSVHTNDILTVPEAVSEEEAEIVIEEASHVLTPLSRGTNDMPLMYCALLHDNDGKKSKGKVNTGDDKLISALEAISREDLAVKLEQSAGNLLLHCMSSDHANLVAERVKDRYGIDIELEAPPIQYKETIRKPVTSIEGRHKKQSGGSE